MLKNVKISIKPHNLVIFFILPLPIASQPHPKNSYPEPYRCTHLSPLFCINLILPYFTKKKKNGGRVQPEKADWLIDWASNTSDNKLKHVVDNKEWVRTSHTFNCWHIIHIHMQHHHQHWLMKHGSWHHPTCVSDISFFFLFFVSLSRKFHFILEIAYTPDRCESEWVVTASFLINC